MGRYRLASCGGPPSLQEPGHNTIGQMLLVGRFVRKACGSQKFGFSFRFHAFPFLFPYPPFLVLLLPKIKSSVPWVSKVHGICTLMQLYVFLTLGKTYNCLCVQIPYTVKTGVSQKHTKSVLATLLKFNTLVCVD